MSFNTNQTKVIGFDLDQTLYPKSPEIDKAIQGYIYERIAQHKTCSVEEARKLFSDLYQEGRGQSGSQTLVTLGIPRAKEIIQEALENADIAQFLAPDPKTQMLLHKLRQKFKALDLITGSFEHVAFIKLTKIGIRRDLFTKIITGEIAKSDGSAFRAWLELYPSLEPHNFLYIGDREKSDYYIPKKLGIETVLVNIKTPNPEVTCLQLPTIHDLEDYLI